MALNLKDINFDINDNSGSFTNYYKDVTVVSISNGFTNSVGTILGGMSQAIPSGVPVLSLSIEKPLNFDERLLSHNLMGKHIIQLSGFSTDDYKSGDIINASRIYLEAVMSEYSISMSAGEVPILSASFVGKTLERDSIEMSYYEYSGEKEIPKMDRVIPYLDLFDDQYIYSITFSERKNVAIRFPIKWNENNIIIQESPLLTQQFSATGYASSLKNFPLQSGIDIIDDYLKTKNSELGFKIISEDLHFENKYYIENSRLNNLSINASDADYLQYSVEFMGARTKV